MRRVSSSLFNGGHYLSEMIQDGMKGWAGEVSESVIPQGGRPGAEGGTQKVVSKNCTQLTSSTRGSGRFLLGILTGKIV